MQSDVEGESGTKWNRWGWKKRGGMERRKEAEGETVGESAAALRVRICGEELERLSPE